MSGPIRAATRAPSLPPPADSTLRQDTSVLPYGNLSGYAGATIDVPDAAVAPWGLSYQGPRELFFRALTLDHYDPQRGWLRRTPSDLKAYPSYRCRRHCLKARLRVVASSEPLVVPLPTGYQIERRSLRYKGKPINTVWRNEYGEAIVRLRPGSAGLLRYVAGWVGQAADPAPRPDDDLPAVPLPGELGLALASLRADAPRKTARQITAWVRDAVDYDVSPQVAQQFALQPGDWLSRVWSTRAGDCDVKNGLNVLLLERSGIRARMAVGIAGYAGHARANLHAWTEYFVPGRGWKVADATGLPPRVPRHHVAVSSAQSASPLRPSRSPGKIKKPPDAATLPVTEVASLVRTRERTPRSAPALLLTKAQHSQNDRQTNPTSLTPRAGMIAPASLSRSSRWERLIKFALFRWPTLLALLATLCALALTWRRLRAHVAEHINLSQDPGQSRAVLAHMLQDALAHPAAWRKVTSLWRRRLLPTLRGPAMSVAEALRRSGDGALFISRTQSELASLAARGKTPILNAADPIFGDVICGLGQAVDLDQLDALRPTPASASGSAAQVATALRPVNALLRKIAPEISCCVCPRLHGSALRDVELALLNLPKSGPWPSRYIAVNPDDHEVGRRIKLLVEDERRGLLVFLDWLLDQSQLLTGRANEIRERAARLTFEATP